MKPVVTAVLVLVLGLMARAAVDEATKEYIREYNKLRRIVIQDCKNNLDAKYMDLASHYSRARRALKQHLLDLHPELRKLRDNSSKRAAVRPYLKDLYEKKDERLQKLIQARTDLDQYLMTLKPKMKELFDKFEPKLREQLILEEQP